MKDAEVNFGEHLTLPSEKPVDEGITTFDVN
jgi:hypothetical protein